MSRRRVPSLVGRAPTAFRHMSSDNITLVPANLLPFRDTWQHLADTLHQNDALLVVPAEDGSLRRTMDRVACQLQRQGRRVTTVNALVRPRLGDGTQDQLRLRPCATSPQPTERRLVANHLERPAGR